MKKASINRFQRLSVLIISPSSKQNISFVVQKGKIKVKFMMGKLIRFVLKHKCHKILMKILILISDANFKTIAVKLRESLKLSILVIITRRHASVVTVHVADIFASSIQSSLILQKTLHTKKTF